MSIGLWEVAVLALLREEPMHPYEMQRLLRERHTDELLPLKRGSLYHAIDRLVRAGLIEAIATSRAGRRPERTTYRLAAGGERELVRRLRETIETPQPESPEFMTCLSFLVHLAPADARARLDERARRLEQEIDHLGAGLEPLRDRIGRIHVVELEYMLAMRRAELAWVRGLSADIRAHRLTWSLRRILAAIRETPPTQEDEP